MEAWEASATSVLPWKWQRDEASPVRRPPGAGFIPRPSKAGDSPCATEMDSPSLVQLDIAGAHTSGSASGSTVTPRGLALLDRDTMWELLDEFETKLGSRTEERITELFQRQSSDLNVALEDAFRKFSGKQSLVSMMPVSSGSSRRTPPFSLDAEKSQGKSQRLRVVFSEPKENGELERAIQTEESQSVSRKPAGAFGRGTEWMKKQLSGLSRYEPTISPHFSGFRTRLRRQHNFELSQGVQGLLYRKISSPLFSYFVALVICADVVFVGYATDLSMQRAESREPSDNPSWVRNVELAFSTVFVTELLLRICVYRLDYIFGEDWKWNVMDFLLVALSLVGHAVGHRNTAFGMLRGLRVARMFHAVRVSHTCASLRMMICCLFNSLGVLLWALVLLLLVLYFFTIIFMQAAAGYMFEANRAGRVEDPVCIELRRLYGNFTRAMLSLFMALTGGADWEEMLNPLVSISHAYAWCFVGFIFFVTFGVFNVLIGVFAERAFKSSSLDKDLLIHAAQERRDLFIREACEMFAGLDTEGSGEVTREAFVDSLKNSAVLSYLQMHHLDWIDPNMFFQMIDEDNSGKVDLKELIMGMIRFGGHAKAVDLMLLHHHTKKLEAAMTTSLSHINRRLGQLLHAKAGQHRM